MVNSLCKLKLRVSFSFQGNVRGLKCTWLRLLGWDALGNMDAELTSLSHEAWIFMDQLTLLGGWGGAEIWNLYPADAAHPLALC